MKWVDARMANGRLKFPNLSELYSRCFPGESFPAHDALEDVKAVAKCLPVILELGLVELKVKEYPDETDISQTVQDGTKATAALGKAAKATAKELSKAAQIAADAVQKFVTSPEKPGNGPNLDAKTENDKLPVQTAKAPEIENSTKITGVAAELLDANEF